MHLLKRATMRFAESVESAHKVYININSVGFFNLMHLDPNIRNTSLIYTILNAEWFDSPY